MKRRAFTLIELLVVIAIIGLLSTVAVAATGTSREKARLNATRSFAAQVDRVDGDSLVGQWDFDEGSGTAVADFSGFKNNGTLSGGSTWSTDTPSGTGWSLSVGATSYASVSDNDILDIGTGSATRTMWFKTSQADRGIMLRKSDAGNSNGILCDIGGNGGVPGAVACIMHLSPVVGVTASGKYNDGAWHHLAFVMDRNANKSSIYLDGKLRGTADISVLSGINLNSANLVTIGYSANGLVGLIDSVHFFNQALTAMNVQKMYLAELPKRLAAY